MNRTSYDHRIRNRVATCGLEGLPADLAIPKSTIYSWIRRGPVNVSGEVQDNSAQTHVGELEREVERLRKELVAVKSLFDFYRQAHEIFGLQLSYQRLPDVEGKEKLLELVDQQLQNFPLKKLLNLIGFSYSRYKRWHKRKKECQLADVTDCPRMSVQQLTRSEVERMKSYVSGEVYRHFSMRSLCWLAKREGKLFASYATWQKYSHVNGWRHPGVRYFPTTEKVGVRAKRPNEIWHIDLSQIRVPDGTVYYLQAIIDNFSRYVLAWRVMSEYSAQATAELLVEARKKAGRLRVEPEVYSDGGRENVNGLIRELVENDMIRHTVARIEVHYSNSMIESLFWGLKNNYLYYQRISSFESLKNHIDFYLKDHNMKIPREALAGATPEETYFGRWNPADLDKIKFRSVRAREVRKKVNRSVQCEMCAA